MARSLLLDTGAIVALLDRSQKQHEEVRAFYESWVGRVVTSEAVVTESTHLLRRATGGVATCLDFFVRGGATVVPTSRPALQRCAMLTQKYADLPMDYADATLVVLAEEIGTEVVLTTDRRDFGIYRTESGKSFTVVP